MKKSVKSIHPCKSVMQTIYDIVKAHGSEVKVETQEGEGSNIYYTNINQLNNEIICENMPALFDTCIHNGANRPYLGMGKQAASR